MNNVTLVGRITRDLELRKTQSGNSVVSFNLAVNRNRDEADFPSVVVWNEVADNLCKYQGKGSQIGVEGRLQTRNYEDKNGNKVYVTEVVAYKVHYLDSKEEAEERRSQGGSTQNYYEDKEEEFGGLTIDVSSDDLPF